MFGGCPGSIWGVCGRYLEGVWWVSVRGVFKRNWYVGCIWGVSRVCLGGICEVVWSYRGICGVSGGISLGGVWGGVSVIYLGVLYLDDFGGVCLSCIWGYGGELWGGI